MSLKPIPGAEMVIQIDLSGAQTITKGSASEPKTPRMKSSMEKDTEESNFGDLCSFSQGRFENAEYDLEERFV